jgi:anhydro-N-acetylmuramic acid kinase
LIFTSFNKPYLWSLGVMSGTSLDAIDLAMLKTDGEVILEHGLSTNIPIPPALQEELWDLMQGKGDFLSIEDKYSRLVAHAIKEFIVDPKVQYPDVIGLHGQTITHRPSEGLTWQLGNPNLVASLTGIGVVADFRRRDMVFGGQGAPLVPIYHAALAADLPKPLAVVNIGGVSNITYIGAQTELIAFDTGVGNALLNDWVYAHTGEHYDADGRYAGAGAVHSHIVEKAMEHPYFAAKPPKSLDRNAFSLDMVAGLSLEDGAATLTQFTARSIAIAQRYFAQTPLHWVICGGGTHNPAIMNALSDELQQEIISADAVGWRIDAVEAEAFAYLAVRSLRGLPLTLPSTTGVSHALTGGVFCQA